MKKAFTITELLLAISLMVVLIATSGVVFQTAVKAHRTASATAEITRKLRGITDQLNADFKGLRKDGEILVIWVPSPVDVDGNPLGAGASAAQIDHYERFDRMMFFADGDFQSYNEWPPGAPTEGIVRGNVARVFYMLANDDLDKWPGVGPRVPGKVAQFQDAQQRILARSQHIFTGDPALVDLDPADPALPHRTVWIDPANIFGQISPPPVLGEPDRTGAFTQANDNYYEYDNLTLDEWLNFPLAEKQEVLTVISNVIIDFDPDDGIAPVAEGGGLAVNVDTKPPLNVYQLLCQGVGEFSIQGWYEDPVLGPRWYPQLDLTPVGGVITDKNDTDFIYDDTAGRLHATDVGGVLYDPAYDDIRVTRGLGRALKFTFTLYDSRGVFKEGKKFTHIVYLDD